MWGGLKASRLPKVCWPVFDPQSAPRVFAVPIGCDFVQAFAAGLQARMAAHPPEALARIEVFVNTQRMARRLKNVLSQNGAVLLPKIRVITDISSHPDLPISLANPTSKLRRQLILAQAVGALLAADETVAPQSAKFDLATSLAGVLDEMQGEGVSFDALAKVDVESHSEHWTRSLKFLEILAQHLERDHPTDPQHRQRVAAEAFATTWAENPPSHPVLAIGSTGSRNETALFLRAVATLPQGAVILPGLDRALTQANWDALTGKHEGDNVAVDNPQSALALFCKGLGVPRSTISDWGQDVPVNPARNALVSLALRPAPFTDQWLDDGPKLIGDLEQAIDGFSLVAADTPQEEALTVALRLRAAADEDQKAVLITPDRTLTRRVTAILERWGILPDDSAGRPLHLTPPGVFLRMIASAMGQRLTPLALVGLLKHPLTDSGPKSSDGEELKDGSSRRFAREYEKAKLRGGAPFVDFQAIKDWADKDTKNPARRVWADWVERCFAPLEAVSQGDLDAFLEAHLSTALALAAGPSGAEEHGLWDKETGVKARSVFTALQREAEVAGVLSVPDYQALFRAILGAETVREARATHPKIAIWGTLEARVESADVVILGGLNDTIWPGAESPDPWLNRAMRSQIGLPPPERLIGLSAHDFQQGCGAKELVISRSLRDGDAPTVASRWVVRILNLLNGLGPEGKNAAKTITRRGQDWIDFARLMDRPETQVAPAVRPSPMPPKSARLDRISVTQVERLIRDPYAVYAAKILGLRQLDPLGREPDALVRGIALHKVVEQFVKAWPTDLPDDAEAAFLRIAEDVLQDEVPWPAMQRIWLARLARIAGWFVKTEAERRKIGSHPVQEVKGVRRIDNLYLDLSAKADRIDQTDAGRLLIYDYKSGSPPTVPQTEFFNKQLQLEAAIAAVGGFEDLAQGDPVLLQYIGLSGAGQDAEGKTLTLETSREDAEAVWREFVALMTWYSAADTGFPSRTRMQQMHFSYEFDHLARKGEWEESDAPVNGPVGADT